MILDNHCPKGWLYKTVEDVSTKVTSGGTPSRKKSDYYSITGYCWVKTKELENKYIYDTEEKISEIGLRKSSAKLLPKNTLLVAMYGATVGKLGMTSKEMTCNQACCAIVTNPIECIPLFLFYKFLNSSKKLEMLSIGAAQQNLSGQFIKEIQFSFPNINNQERIVAVLSNLDSKIELNQKMNETLEEIAKTLFKSWFIDFDPVRAKAEGRPTGLQKEISDLFPDSFEDSELGEIPEGFKVDSVDNRYDISIGKTPPRKEPQWFSENQQDIPWASIKDMGDAGVYINKTSEFLTNEAIEKFNIRVIPKNNVILSFKLTVGRVSILQKDMCTNEAIAHFVPKDNDLSKVFTYCLLKSIRYESLSSTSSIATAVNSKIIKAMKCIFPSKALLIAFNEFCHPIYKKIETNTNEIETLLSLRDALLPKLISGELKIPDAENLVEEAGI